jgi:ferredoxin-nitrite reductase
MCLKEEIFSQLCGRCSRAQSMANPVEVWKSQKHGFDVWPDVLRYAQARIAMADIETPDLERMKWYGAFYRKRDGAGTYMLRIRLTGCELSAEQARAIAFVAYQFGYGIVDITTRANIQVQGLAIEHVPEALERLEATGLSARQTGHDNIRNVYCHPFSGVATDELIDTRQLCRDITSLFVGSRIYSDLPRKFNIAVSGNEQHASHYWSQDLSFLACRSPEGDVQFQVLFGGTQGQNPHLAWHLPVLVRPEQAVEVTKSLLDLFREQGSREKRDAARFRYLVERIGVPGVLEWLEARLPFPLRPCVSEPAPPAGYDDLIGWFRQKQPELWAMGLCVPVGRLTWQQLEGLALAAKKWGDGTLRATPEQGMAILNIPAGFKDAAATAVAAHGISPYADTLARNTVACTGKQFCNIAVTETKGHMLQLIEKLRARALTLHGIRIHMSGCPSSCAQHFTADIGLKGVRVRRLLGTREGFDVYVGGGIAGQVHLGLPYKLGVDVDQLPQLVEDVVQEYYLRHKPGMTFSAYWREKLRDNAAAKVGDGEYTPPTWLCETCQYRHKGEDPPVYCPKCAGLRRNFARLEGGVDVPPVAEAATPAAQRSDGFAFAAAESQLTDTAGLAVDVAGKEYALFRIDGRVYAIDNACPHEGAPLAQGEIADGIVTCPWHGWTFNACTGCSLNPAGNDLKSYPVKVEEGQIFIQTGAATPATAAAPVAAPSARSPLRQRSAAARPAEPKLASLKVLEVIQETPDVKTFRLDNSGGDIPRHRPGQFVKVRATLDGREVWRSFTISSSPDTLDRLDLTIKRNPAGEFSNHLHDVIEAGSLLTVKGPQGGFFFDGETHCEPLVLISAGSGITPMMSILRHLADTASPLSCTFLHGARTAADIIFHDECRRLAGLLPGLNYQVALSQPADAWDGLRGRLTFETVHEIVGDLAVSRYFLCGPGDFMLALQQPLVEAGVPAARIHTEQFHASPAPMRTAG